MDDVGGWGAWWNWWKKEWSKYDGIDGWKKKQREQLNTRNADIGNRKKERKGYMKCKGGWLEQLITTKEMGAPTGKSHKEEYITTNQPDYQICTLEKHLYRM